MSFVNEFADMFTDTAIWEVLASRDGYGKPVFDTPEAFAARLSRKHKLVRDTEGHEVVSTAHIWLEGTPAVSPQDQITLSDGTTPAIISVERFQDEEGDSHTKVFFL